MYETGILPEVLEEWAMKQRFVTTRDIMQAFGVGEDAAIACIRHLCEYGIISWLGIVEVHE